jgi:hypothetical protein
VHLACRVVVRCAGATFELRRALDDCLVVSVVRRVGVAQVMTVAVCIAKHVERNSYDIADLEQHLHVDYN